MKPESSVVWLGLDIYWWLVALALSINGVGVSPVFGGDEGRAQVTTTNPEAVVIIDNDSEPSRQAIDLSTLTIDDSGRFVLPVLNRTGADLHILNVSSSCSCTAAALRDEIISPGKESQIWLQINDSSTVESQQQWVRIEFGAAGEKRETIVFLKGAKISDRLETTIVSSTLSEEGQIHAVVRIDPIGEERMTYAPHTHQLGEEQPYVFESFVVLPIHVKPDDEGRFRRSVPLEFLTDKQERLRVDLPTDQLLRSAGVQDSSELIKPEFLRSLNPELSIGILEHGAAIELEIVVPGWPKRCEPKLVLDPPRATVLLVKSDYDELGTTFTVSIAADVVRRGVLDSRLELQCDGIAVARNTVRGKIVRPRQ